MRVPDAGAARFGPGREGECAQKERHCGGCRSLHEPPTILDTYVGTLLPDGASHGRDVIGTTVQHYRIVERLGAGGMGEVYRADDLRLGRPVALKFLSPSLKSDPESRARLLNEARAASMLRSPNIAVTYDIGESEGADFIAMEYVDGESLAARLSRRSAASARSRPGRDPGCRCARRSAHARHHPSRHQERQLDADRARPDQGARFRSRQDPAARERSTSRSRK